MSMSSTAGDDSPPSLLIPDLPNDVALQCLARTPRLQHHSLSLVSKSWRDVLKSPLFFNTRSFLDCKEHLLYLNFHINNSFRWYVISQNSPRVLRHAPPIPSEKMVGSTFAVLGSKIYSIGGSVNDIPSPNFWVFDCRLNKWEMGPSMSVGREYAVAEVVGGRIYVLGGCGCLVDTTEWAEVFDPEIGEWETVMSPIEVRDKWVHGSVVMEGRVLFVTGSGLGGGFIFDPKEMTWEVFPIELKSGWSGRAAVVQEVLYCFDYHLGKVRGYDAESDVWKEVKGIEEIMPKLLFGVEMASMGGSLVLVWEEKGNGGEKEVSCAEIEIRTDVDGELWGSIVWSDVIVSVPPRSAIGHALAIEL